MSALLKDRIEETIRPIVGTVLASVSIELEAKRLGKRPDELDVADLEELAGNLGRQLSLVVGGELAAAAEAKVRELT